MELNIAEQTVYEVLCKGKEYGGLTSLHIMRILDDGTSLSVTAVNNILKSLQEKCLVEYSTLDTSGRWGVAKWRILTPVEIIAAKKKQKATQKYNESHRQLTAQEKNALVVAKRKGLVNA